MNEIHFAKTARRAQTGVTLIELLITIVIVGTLAAIALPSYRTYQQRAHRTEAKSALLRLQADQERYYLDNGQYATDPADLQSFADDKSENAVYTLSISSANPTQAYTAKAVPTTGGGGGDVDMSDDSHCAEFTITSDGVRGATNADCW